MNMQTATAPVVDTIRKELGEIATLDSALARTMPPVFYTSADFHELEKEELFRKEWICLGHVGEIPEPGDYFTTELVDEQLIVSHAADGAVHVLSNVCRHRGNLVAEGKGNRRSFVCGYHAWTYDLDGALKTAPLMSKVKGFDKKKCGLPRLRSEVWNNFIFVNLDGQAAPLAPQLSTLDKILHNYHNDGRNLLFTDEDVWETNWKNLTENFMEGYHLFATHPKTLQPMTPTQLCRKVPGEERWTAYRSYYDPDFPPRGPFHEDMTEDEQRNTVLFNIFPSFVVAVAANYTLYLCLRPAGVGKVAIRWGVAGFKTDPEDAEVVKYVQLCKDFNAEDRAKLETLQKAQNTRYFQSGPLAPDDLEGTIWDFLLYMARRFA
ncbi:aromatic ring-hydroxylating dioxygenase subunit alpha [Defluviimonas sp. D31]|uniref:aromatic ring-hydroxylating oxygenase subunit alpha n=1 Tax=Defluviimonas sp. D31 TaxID=3083253 RepID=UPI00296E97EF|nr:aromatic ring-hydroxylating dioxygenase subunit alpha [Defluviimonas sp. D31]